MNKIDIATTVMNRVAKFEEHRLNGWLRLFFITFSLIIMGVCVFAWFAYREFASSQVGSLFVLFGEDWEIIRDYLPDTLSTIWLELPKGYLVISLLLLAGMGIFLYSTKRQRRIIAKKKHELSALKQKDAHA